MRTGHLIQVLAFGCIAGCSEPRSDEQASQAASAKQSSPIDTAQSSSSAIAARNAIVADAAFGDSTTFDPDGYYLPQPELVSGGLKLELLEIRTLEYFYDGALHYERPRLHAPKVIVRIKNLRLDAHSDRECERVTVSRDGLRLDCPGTLLGDLSVDATYLDRRGRYWNIIDYELERKSVAEGRLIIRRARDTLAVRDLAFVYTGGH